MKALPEDDMKKVIVILTVAQRSWLRAEAGRQTISMSALMRHALTAYKRICEQRGNAEEADDE